MTAPRPTVAHRVLTRHGVPALWSRDLRADMERLAEEDVARIRAAEGLDAWQRDRHEAALDEAMHPLGRHADLWLAANGEEPDEARRLLRMWRAMIVVALLVYGALAVHVVWAMR